MPGLLAEKRAIDELGVLFEATAAEVLESVSPDSTGGGLLLCFMRDAAANVRRGDLDGALQDIDGADSVLEQLRENIRDLGRAIGAPSPNALTQEAVLAFIGDGRDEREVVEHFSPHDPEENGGPVISLLGDLLDDETGAGLVHAEGRRLTLTEKGRRAIAGLAPEPYRDR